MAGGSSKFEKIVTMIEESEKLKSSVESKAEHLADQSGSLYFGWNWPGISVYPKCDKGSGCADGGLFLCIEAGHADFRAVCHPGSKPLQCDGKGRQISGGYC